MGCGPQGEDTLNPSQYNQDMVKGVYDRLGAKGRWALLIALLAAIMLLLWTWSLLSAVLLPASGTASAQADEKQRLAELQEKFKQQIAQFDGRTVFYVPAAPGAKPPPEEHTDSSDKAPEKPSTYGGPGIIAMINDVVWFSDGSRVKSGETVGDIKVAAVKAPWEATVLWKGVEFKVNFFERDGVVLNKTKSSSSASSLAADAAKSDAAKPDSGKPDAEKGDGSKADPTAQPVEAGTTKPAEKPGDKPGEAKPAEKPGDKKPAEKPQNPPPPPPGEPPPDSNGPPPPSQEPPNEPK